MFFFSFMSFLGIFSPKTMLKSIDMGNVEKCIHFVSFYKTDTLYWVEFVFYFFPLTYFYSLLRYQISLQNLMFSALKPKLLSSALLIILRWENNKPSEHKPCHRSSYPDHLTITESTFMFLLTMSLATDLSTTFFPFIISKLMFIQLLFLELLLFLLLFMPVYHQVKIWLTLC